MSTISLVLSVEIKLISHTYLLVPIIKINFNFISPFNLVLRLSTVDFVLPNSILVEVKFVVVVSKRSEVAKSFNLFLNQFHKLKKRKRIYHSGLFSDFLRLLLVRD
jgi:hypothetical protein